MIWFWIIAALLIVAALFALLRPLIRGAGRGADQSESVVALFRRQLADIDTELAQGRLAPDQAAGARGEITRRMLAAADRERGGSSLVPGSPAEMSWRISAAVGIASLLPAAALAIYFTVGAPTAIDRARAGSAAAGTVDPHEATSLAAAADQLKARLQREPGHIDGWVLLGRTLASLGRFADALDAYSQAIALAPNEPALHAELGEVLVLAAGGSVIPEAEAEFAKSGNDPRARYYGAEAALQRGDNAAAKTALHALLAEAPADAPWRQIVSERLAEIAPGEQNAKAPEAAARPSAGPTAQDVAAAQSMSPEERQVMIRGMVDRLATRLEQNPDDREGWSRLARAYDVLGEAEKAQAARVRAAALGAPPAASPAPAAQAPSPGK
jgi:cytochrome c-type biogenesis protein CcmH